MSSLILSSRIRSDSKKRRKLCKRLTRRRKQKVGSFWLKLNRSKTDCAEKFKN